MNRLMKPLEVQKKSSDYNLTVGYRISLFYASMNNIANFLILIY